MISGGSSINTDDFNNSPITITDEDELLTEDVPKMINQYEKKNKLKFYVNTNEKSGEKTQRYHKGVSPLKPQ